MSSQKKSNSKRVSREQREDAERLASAQVTPRAKKQKKDKTATPEVEPEVEAEVEEEEVEEEAEVEEGEEKSKSEDEEDLGEFSDASSKSGDSQNGPEHDSQDRSVVISKSGHKEFRSKQNREFDPTKHGCGAWMSQNDVINTLTERLQEAQRTNAVPTVVLGDTRHFVLNPSNVGAEGFKNLRACLANCLRQGRAITRKQLISDESALLISQTLAARDMIPTAEAKHWQNWTDDFFFSYGQSLSVWGWALAPRSGCSQEASVRVLPGRIPQDGKHVRK
jgi:hypothetical protein